jgi:hypothetical protein
MRNVKERGKKAGGKKEIAQMRAPSSRFRRSGGAIVLRARIGSSSTLPRDLAEAIDACFPLDSASRIRRATTLVNQALKRSTTPSLLVLKANLLALARPVYSPPVSAMLPLITQASKTRERNVWLWESIGYFWDCYGRDLNKARRAFERSLEIDITPDSVIGLGRVLAQLGKRKIATRFLSQYRRRPSFRRKILKLQREIATGLWD